MQDIPHIDMTTHAKHIDVGTWQHEMQKRVMHLQCPGNGCANVRLVFWKQSSKSKISNLRCEVLLKQNIAQFYVPMNDSHM